VVWFSDQEWSALTERASKAGLTRSSYIKLALEQRERWEMAADIAAENPHTFVSPTAGIHFEAQPERPMSEHFNTRPFTPVPKGK
jgi:hypothetical protein